MITGASAGIGRQAAISASAAGARVFVTGRNGQKLAETFSALVPGPEHLSSTADLTLVEDRERLAGELPAIDGLVHCAGLTLLRPFKFSDEQRYREVYAINVEAPYFLTQCIMKARKLNTAASIVFISSISPNVGTKGHSVYSGSKAAVQGISRVLAHEMAAQKIRSNCISPGMVTTEVAEGMAEQISPELLALDQARYPLGYGTPEDVAHAVVFFLAPASRWITGTNLIMDGGLT